MNEKRAADLTEFDSALRLFSTVNESHLHNYETLKSLRLPGSTEPAPVFRIKSINNCSVAFSSDSAATKNLEHILYLSIGARVMLRRNLWTWTRERSYKDSNTYYRRPGKR